MSAQLSITWRAGEHDVRMGNCTATIHVPDSWTTERFAKAFNPIIEEGRLNEPSRK
ncbi:hypothetical protein SAMN02910314_00353 [Denitrobacterium detoxificans]|uniref:Uncharacterized protein n=1 Tax=Denitrobacterium detoxificans TaxID=79604 RepID=A0A1H8PYH7_9ACTN|nr:hypothetical protein SAMN02910314_00353 [Denitrobacterium detoxificans]